MLFPVVRQKKKTLFSDDHKGKWEVLPPALLERSWMSGRWWCPRGRGRRESSRACPPPSRPSVLASKQLGWKLCTVLSIRVHGKFDSVARVKKQKRSLTLEQHLCPYIFHVLMFFYVSFFILMLHIFLIFLSFLICSLKNTMILTFAWKNKLCAVDVVKSNGLTCCGWHSPVVSVLLKWWRAVVPPAVDYIHL